MNFYFADLDEVEAFRRIVTTVVGTGAQFAGKGLAHTGRGERDETFSGIRSQPLDTVSIFDMASFESHLANHNTRLLQLYLINATGTTKGVAEIVTYLSISPQASDVDRHPFAIWTEGESFAGLKFLKGAEQKGKKVYERFCGLVEELSPSYAAITVEYDLECPADLRRDSRSQAFHDFFVSENYLGSEKMNSIRARLAKAFSRPIKDGYYFSGTKEFNPLGSAIENENLAHISSDVAKVIATK